MSKLLDIIKTAFYVHFEECRDGALWYSVTYGVSDNAVYGESALENAVQYAFRIPLEDVAGAVFPATDENPKYYMRWIRKQLEVDAEQKKTIADAKAAWQEENK